MKEKVKNFFAVLVLVVTLPYIFTMAFQRKTPEVVPVSAESKELEEYLIARVALDIPVNYEMEAIKAQAILARTAFLLEKQENKKFTQKISLEELMDLWGKEDYEKNYKKISLAV